MCGRFGTPFTSVDLADALAAVWNFPEPQLPRFNVAPTQHAPVLLQKEGRRVLDMVRWGLIPSWARDGSIGNKMINARAETVVEKPSYRSAFAKRRCLVPAGGFFEWKREGKVKVPHWIHPAEGGPITFAGLWESWRPAPDAEWVQTFTIITTTPSAEVAGIHDRMPVIVAPGDRSEWLDPASPAEALAALLRPAPDGYLTTYPVSTAVNRPTYDGPDLIQPALA